MSTILRVNSFILCVCSPVLHKMLCGSFIERNEKKLNLQDVDGKTFSKALAIWCGKLSSKDMGLGELMALASVADRFQMIEVLSAIE